MMCESRSYFSLSVMKTMKREMLEQLYEDVPVGNIITSDELGLKNKRKENKYVSRW